MPERDQLSDRDRRPDCALPADHAASRDVPTLIYDSAAWVLAEHYDRAVETRENANAVSVRVEADVARLRAALQEILDMPCPFGRLGDPLGDAQKTASAALVAREALNGRRLVMGLIERWTIEGAAPDDRALINVAGPMIPPHAQRRVVLESDYDALAADHRGAVEAEREALRMILDADVGDWDRTIPTLAQWAETRLRELGGQ